MANVPDHYILETRCLSELSQPDGSPITTERLIST